MLHKIPRLPGLIIENLVQQFGSFSDIHKATVEELDDVEGIGEVRANKIKEGLRLLKIQLVTDQKNVVSAKYLEMKGYFLFDMYSYGARLLKNSFIYILIYFT